MCIRDSCLIYACSYSFICKSIPIFFNCSWITGAAALLDALSVGEAYSCLLYTSLEFELNPEGYRYYLYSYNNTSKTKPYNLAVQKRLSQLGYFSGSIDGNYAEDTEDAIETFQRVHGQPITGNRCV